MKMVSCTCSRISKFILSLVLFALLLVSPAVGMCAEKTYTLTESEMNQLWNNLNELETVNQKLTILLNQSTTDLQTVSTESIAQRKELTELKAQLVQLQNETVQAKNSLIEAQKSLDSLNQSWKQSEKEKKIIKMQRNIWETVSTILGIVVIAGAW